MSITLAFVWRTPRWVRTLAILALTASVSYVPPRVVGFEGEGPHLGITRLVLAALRRTEGPVRGGPPLRWGHRVIFDVFRPKSTKENTTMALDQSALSDLLASLQAGGDLDFMREAMQLVLQALIDLEAEQQIGAARYERADTRTTHRNGTRARLLSTKAGDVELAIPKLRHGSFYPSLLEPRRRIDRALWAVIMEAFVHGVSTRKVDDLVQALGIDAGVSKSQVSRICAELDGAVAEFRERRLGSRRVPLRVLRRHLREGPRRRPRRVEGDRRGHRRRR